MIRWAGIRQAGVDIGWWWRCEMCGIDWNNYSYHQIHHLQSEIVQIRQQTTKLHLTHISTSTTLQTTLYSIITKSIYFYIYISLESCEGSHVLVIKDFKNSHISRNNIGKRGCPCHCAGLLACVTQSPAFLPPLYTCTQIVSSHHRIDQSLSPNIFTKMSFMRKIETWASLCSADHPDSDLIPWALFHTDSHNNSIGHCHQTVRRLIIESDQNFTISAIICKLFIISPTVKIKEWHNLKRDRVFMLNTIFESLSKDRWVFNDLYWYFETLFDEPNWNHNIKDNSLKMKWNKDDFCFFLDNNKR